MRTFAGEPGWSRQDFIREAMDNADLPSTPLARFLKFEIVSLPSPQIILTQDHGAIPHRGVVFDLRPVGGRICVLDVTADASFLDALLTLQGRLAHEAAQAALDGMLGGTCVSHVNGRIVNVWATLPVIADTVQFYPVGVVRRMLLAELNRPPRKLITTRLQPLQAPALLEIELPQPVAHTASSHLSATAFGVAVWTDCVVDNWLSAQRHIECCSCRPLLQRQLPLRETSQRVVKHRIPVQRPPALRCPLLGLRRP